MTEVNGDEKTGTPSLRDRMRPLELLAMAGGIGIFVGLIVGLSTREWILAAIFCGVVFIVSLVVLAMLSLAVGPPTNTLPGGDEDGPTGH